MSDAQSHASISTDSTLLDVPWMVRSIQGSYWGGKFEDDALRRAIANSLVFGAYANVGATCPKCGGIGNVDDVPGRLLLCPPCGGSGHVIERKQIGFVRAVTDHGVFSSITDVFVDESHRGKGVGSALIKAAIEHPSIGKTYCILRARPEAWLWYFSHADFHVFDRKSGLMQRMPR